MEPTARSEDVNNKAPVLDARLADAGYTPFPSFQEWESSHVDTTRWERYTATVRERQNASPELLRRAEDVVMRAAAVDTGAIEGLYETDRGFTFTVAMQAAAWETLVDRKGRKVRALIESQLETYDSVLDLATARRPVTEAWIRGLHAEICRGQETYMVQTEVGPQEQELPLGEYKRLPNHVLGRDGVVHSYAPVDLTPAEMHRFIVQLHSEDFAQAHPVLQASYAHYAFVVLHPFADGNGRVARALASVYTYRSHSIPLLVLVDNRDEYISALEAADRGNFQPFVDFVLLRSLDAIQMVAESLRTAKAAQAPDALSSLRRLYITKGGYTHAEVDKAGYSLFEAFFEETRKQLALYDDADEIEATVYALTSSAPPANDANRQPLTEGGRGLRLALASKPPAQAVVGRNVYLEVPKDAGKEDDVVLRIAETWEQFEARVGEMLPTLSVAVQMRLSMFVQKLIGDSLLDLVDGANQQLKMQGYNE